MKSGGSWINDKPEDGFYWYRLIGNKNSPLMVCQIGGYRIYSIAIPQGVHFEEIKGRWEFWSESIQPPPTPH